MPGNSKDLLKRNMLDRYKDRPGKICCTGKYQLLDEMCYAEFLSNYIMRKIIKPINAVTASQPEILHGLLHSSKSVEQSDLPNFSFNTFQGIIKTTEREMHFKVSYPESNNTSRRVCPSHAIYVLSFQK